MKAIHISSRRKTLVKTFLGLSVSVIIPCSVYINSNNAKKHQFHNYLHSGLRFMSCDEYSHQLSECHKKSADLILQGCLDNGGLFVKMGQGLASMNHVLPLEYTKTLERLNDKALFRSNDEVERIFKEDFGKLPSELFSHFEKEPIAAASLAQVHKAITKKGETVAVKIQYEDLRDRFLTDIQTIKILLHFVKLFHPTFGFAWIIDDIQKTLALELDFENEADNSCRCIEDLAFLGTKRENGDVHVPWVDRSLTSKRVLTAEFIDGIKINEISSLRDAGFSLSNLDTLLIRTFSHQVFCTGFVHADPHPGNLLVRRKPKSDASKWNILCQIKYLFQLLFRFPLYAIRLFSPNLYNALISRWDSLFASTPLQLVLLDHGLYDSLPDSKRIALCQMYQAIMDSDEIRMKQASTTLGVEDWEAFGEVIVQRPWRRQTLKLPSKLSDADREYLRKVAMNHFDRIMIVIQQMPRPMLLFIRNLNLIRSICRSHGDPVDRYSIMIYSAVLGGGLLDNTQHDSSPFFLSGPIAQIRLQLILQRYYLLLKFEALRRQLYTIFYFFLYCIGCAPNVAEISAIFNNNINNNEVV